MNLPFTDVLKDIFSYPLAPAAGGEGSPAMNYGLVVPWLLLPAGALALIALPRAWLRGRPRSVERERAELALWLSFPAALVLVTSPALFAARYHLFVVGAAMALVSWFLGAHLRARRAATAFVAAATVFGLMTAFWGGGAIVTPDMMRRLLATPYPEREVRPDLGAPVQREVGLARETELHAGDIVTFYNTSVFVSLLWNNHYSNKVIYVPSVADYVERSEAMGATWLLCAPWDPCFAKLNQSDSGWEAIGQLDLHFPAQVFHRSKN
jgi:hypothetical protein